MILSHDRSQAQLLPNLSREEVIRRLRALSHPATLFGEVRQLHASARGGHLCSACAGQRRTMANNRASPTAWHQPRQ